MADEGSRADERVPPGQFPQTRWSVVLAACNANDSSWSAAALDDLCRAYWFPLYVYIRRRGISALLDNVLEASGRQRGWSSSRATQPDPSETNHGSHPLFLAAGIGLAVSAGSCQSASVRWLLRPSP